MLRTFQMLLVLSENVDIIQSDIAYKGRSTLDLELDLIQLCFVVYCLCSAFRMLLWPILENSSVNM